MHRLKGKVEAYVVSTMEDNQRTSLLDNLAITIEKVEEEADTQKRQTNERIISDDKLVDDLCDSILCVLEHELKITNNRQKPSFWDVAENITPKDTIKMIYRLNIQQTDKTRCHAWARLALKEATISSYILLIRDDTQLLKEWYKSSAFVRDKMKMDTAYELINEAVSNTIFSFSIENEKGTTMNYGKDGGISPEIPQEIRYTARKTSTSSIDSASRRKKKSRTSSIAAISDSSSSNIPSSWSDSYLRNQMEPHTGDQVVARSYNDSPLLRVKEVINEKVTDESLDPGSPTFEPVSPTGTLRVFGSITHSELSPFKEVIPHTNKETIPSMLVKDSNENNECDDSLTEGDIPFRDRNEIVLKQQEGSPPKDLGNYSLASPVKNPGSEIENESDKTDTENTAIGEGEPEIDEGNSVLDRDNDFVEDENDLTDKGDISTDKLIENDSSTQCSSDEEYNKTSENNSMIDEENLELEGGDQSDSDGNHLANLENPKNTSDNEVTKTDGSSPFSHSEPSDSLNEVEDELEFGGRTKTPTLNSTYDQTDDYSMFEDESSEITIDDQEDLNPIRKSNSFSGGSQQLVNVLQLSTSVSSADDYFIPGIHQSPDADTMHEKSEPIVSLTHASSAHKNEASDSMRSGTLPSTLGSSVSSSAYTFGSEDSESDSLSMGDQSFSLLADLGITDDFIGMKEDHFSNTDSFMGFSSTEELENAITTCKQLIKQTNEKSPGRRDLIQQLIQLRLKLHESKEGHVEVPKNAKKVLGHHFIKQEKLANSIPCDRCSSTIFPMLQIVYQCRDCGFHCHRKCLKSLDKGCIFSKQTVNSACEMRICPEVSLSQQQFRCADCHQRLIELDGQFDARLCDYTGKRYCGQCHWNELVVIPARVIHNWDFIPRKVSRQSKQLLQLRYKKADINLQKINPALFNFLDDLRNIKTLREQLMMMKEYIRTCRIATEERMLLQLQNRQHFVENSFVFSMQDLLDVHSNALYEELEKKIELFAKHIKKECPLCIGKGFICERCHSDDIIFPFDNHVVRCQCNATYHRSCFVKDECPRCIRTARRKEDKEKQDFQDNESE